MARGGEPSLDKGSSIPLKQVFQATVAELMQLLRMPAAPPGTLRSSQDGLSQRPSVGAATVARFFEGDLDRGYNRSKGQKVIFSQAVSRKESKSIG